MIKRLLINSFLLERFKNEYLSGTHSIHVTCVECVRNDSSEFTCKNIFMKNTFSYLEQACTKILAKMDNLEQISSLLKEMTQYTEENIEGHAEKPDIFYFIYEKTDDQGQVVDTIKEAKFFEKIVKEFPEIRSQVLEYVESIPVEKLDDISFKGIDAMTELALVDSKYYKDFQQFFKRIYNEEDDEVLEFTNSLNRIFASPNCDKAMMELLVGCDELFIYAEDDIELPTTISRELFDYLLKITLEQKKDSITDDIEDVPFYIYATFNKVFPYKDFLDCLFETDMNDRFKRALEAGETPTYDSLLGIKANAVFFSVDDDGIEVIVDIKKEAEVKNALECLCQLFTEDDMENIDYDIAFGKLQEDQEFEAIYDEDDFFSYVIKNYPNLQDTVLDYAFKLSAEVGDDGHGLPEGLSIMTKLATTNKKYINDFGRFLLSRDLNHASAGGQEREYVWEVLSEWDWCSEIIDLAVKCFCTPAQWTADEWIPIDNDIRPDVFNTFIKKLCDRKVYLHEKEAMVYDENFEVKIDYIYQEFFGIDKILAKVFEDQSKEDLYKQFNKALGQNIYPTYEFFKGT